VADVIQSHFPKTEVYVIGIPDHEWGQSLRLVMVSSDEIANVALTQIRDIVGRELGKVAAPRSLLLLPETPLKSNGKVDMQFMATAEPTQAL
jgi:acyl-CoA synthetase (AMP-forming)/AMP-acid ligase II